MNEIRYINMCIVKVGHMQIEAQIFQSVTGKCFGRLIESCKAKSPYNMYY